MSKHVSPVTATKSDPDSPPSYDEADAPPPPDFQPDSKDSLASDSKIDLQPTDSSSSTTSYSPLTPQPAVLALEDDPPLYASITIHSWNRLRFVNFPHSVLEGVDGVARVFYLNGIKWEFEYGQWKMNTNARAFTNADGTAGRYLLLAILTRLSQFGYAPTTTLFANSPNLLDKDTYFFKRTPAPLPSPPNTAMRGLSPSSSPSASLPKSGFFSKLSLGRDGEKERSLPDIAVIQSLDQSRYNVGTRYFCLSIWRSDRMTVLGCPDDIVLDGITKAIAVWPEGVESVTSTEPYGWKWKFKGKPWSTRASDTLTHSKVLLCSILTELDERDWECVLTSRFTRDEEWRDFDTWYFASRT